ncbi:MAG: hypothetical protein JW860_02265 [Sedimentisphaerales bacterium]|nr:hypothetical protein [Sedimentisphaerales bacterium]
MAEIQSERARIEEVKQDIFAEIERFRGDQSRSQERIAQAHSKLAEVTEDKDYDIKEPSRKP